MKIILPNRKNIRKKDTTINRQNPKFNLRSYPMLMQSCPVSQARTQIGHFCVTCNSSIGRRIFFSLCRNETTKAYIYLYYIQYIIMINKYGIVLMWYIQNMLLVLNVSVFCFLRFIHDFDIYIRNERISSFLRLYVVGVGCHRQNLCTHYLESAIILCILGKKSKQFEFVGCIQ